jgi:CheY-like chemotaxis protein
VYYDIDIISELIIGPAMNTVGGMKKKNILLVNSEIDLHKDLNSVVESKLESLGAPVHIITAENMERAVHILQNISIDLVITEPDIMGSGLEFMTWLNNHFPYIPIIATHENVYPAFEITLESISTLQAISTPMDINELTYMILDGLTLASKEKKVRCLTVGAFIYLIELLKKTGFLEIWINELEKGYIYFVNGELYDAQIGERNGGEAALELISLDDVRLSFYENADNDRKKQIDPAILNLLLEALKLKAKTLNSLKADPQTPKTVKTSPDFKKEKEEDKKQDNSHLSRKASGFGLEKALSEDKKSIASREKEQRRKLELEGILKNMAQEIEGCIACVLLDVSGTKIAAHVLQSVNIDAFAAKFTLVMRLLEISLRDIPKLGALEETVVKTNKAWNFTRILFGKYYLGIVFSLKTSPEIVRLVTNKYQQRLKGALT